MFHPHTVLTFLIDSPDVRVPRLPVNGRARPAEPNRAGGADPIEAKRSEANRIESNQVKSNQIECNNTHYYPLDIAHRACLGSLTCVASCA